MDRIIASTYKIDEKIGAGGGGVVYLGEHIRLGKQVVLKADKRTLSSKPEALRREVDALKNLSHTYIPQVYDFVEEDGVVYTVMDYIPGESLDKPLKRGERFSQPMVIEWAYQILDALVYLHSQPPHGILHGDIKPSNIMCTPQGSIRLIDFNIALALGENGAVKAGFSQGYASPEHYGLDYRASAETQGVTNQTQLNAETVLTGATTELDGDSQKSSSTATEKKSVLLDVRSDIYSLGATLYHLLTGERPAQNAKEVMPISPEKASPAVAAIIQKAMAPDPDQRYQTAREMVFAFEELYEKDPRVKRLKRCTALTAAALTALFLIGGVTTFTGLKRMEQAQAQAAQEARLAEEAERRTKQALAAVRSSEEAYRSGNLPAARSSALEALALDSPYAAQAQKALTDALGVYDLSDGFKAYETLELPSEPLKLELSPSGERLAAFYAYETAVFDLGTGERLALLPMEPSALSDVVFRDEDTLLCAGAEGVTAYSLAQNQAVWTGQAATGLALSADGSRAAAVYKDGKTAQIYNASDGTLLKTVDFQDRWQRTAANSGLADPEDNLFALNRNGNLLAASFADGSLTVFDLEREDADLTVFPYSDYTRFQGGFTGPYLAFSAQKDGESVFAVIDTTNAVQMGGFSSGRPFLVQADESGLYVATEDYLVQMDPQTGAQTEAGYPEWDIAAFRHGENGSLAVSADRRYAFFDADAHPLNSGESGSPCDMLALGGRFAVLGSWNAPVLQVLRLDVRKDAQVFSYDPSYSHSEARLSADGQTIMLFRYDGFCLYGMDGTVLADEALPDKERIYDQQFVREGDTSRLDVIWYDGTVRSYSAADGTLLGETKGEPKDPSLREEFLADKWRITSALHEKPAVYDRETGELLGELEEDAALAYATQVGDYVILEFVSAQGERYGLLMNESLETLARLPGLCDIVGERLIFDDNIGNLRESRIYSTQELIALGNKTKEA